MAKKPTLKDLLGQSDRRVQVEYKGVTEAVTPAVVPSSGSPIPVQEMPKTNQLLQVVDAMKKLPKAYATQIGIAQTEAAEEIAKLNDTEIAGAIAENDKNTMSIFGFNKAYNEGLVKRHYQVNAKQYEQRLNNIAANLADNPDIKDFNAALENEVETIKVENAQLFSNNRFQLETNDAAFQEVMGEYVANASGTYLANQQEAVVVQYSSEFRTNLDTSIQNKSFTKETATSHIKTLHNELKNVAIPNSKKGELIAGQVDGYARVLLESGNIEAAEQLINAADKYDITGQKGTLGSAQSNTFSSLKVALEKAKDDESDVDVSDIVTNVKGQYQLQALYLLDDETSNEDDVKRVLTSFRGNVADDKINELVKNIMDTPAGEGRVKQLEEALKTLGTTSLQNKSNMTVEASDITGQAYNQLTGVFASSRVVKEQLSRHRLYGIKGQELEDLEEDAKIAFNNDSKLTITAFMKDRIGTGVEVPDSIRNIYQQAHEIDFIRDSETNLGKRFNGIFTTQNYQNSSLVASLNKRVDASLGEATKTNIENSNRLAVETYLPSLLKEAEEYARGLKGTLEENQTDMEDWLDSNLKSFIEARQAINAAPTVLYQMQENIDFREKDTTAAFLARPIMVNVEQFTDDDVMASDKLMQKQIERSSQKYPHLFNPSRTVVADEALYDTMKNDIPALRATQMLYGYSEYTPSAADDLSKTGFNYREVRLFGNNEEFTNTTKRWREALAAAQEDPDGLTPEQLKTIKEAASFGISINNLKDFIIFQGDFID